MSNYPSVTLIILNWNAREFLPECLASINKLDYPNFTVEVVDNASTDDSLAFLQDKFPQIPVIRNKRNLGFAAGNNVALRQLKTDLAVLLNPDVVVSPNWLSQLVEPMQQDERIGIVGSKLHYPEGHMLQHAGGFLVEPQAFPGHYGIREQDEGQYDTLRDVAYVIGAAMAIRKTMLAETGLFDEGFFLYYEDTDFCFRARRCGYRVVYAPGATAVHVESATTAKGSLSYLRYFYTGRWRFLLKHYDAATLLNETVTAERNWLAQVDSRRLTALAAVYRDALRQLPALKNAKIMQGKDSMDAQSDKEYGEVAEALSSLRGTALTRLSALSEKATPDDSADPFKWQVEERPFTSRTPIFGSLIVWFRAMWNSVAAKWYVRPLLDQQNNINRQTAKRISHLEANFIDIDREQTRAIHDLAELTVQLTQMNRLLQSIDTRLAQQKQGNGSE